MLRLVKDVDVKELEKRGLHPIYECNARTGETRIVGYDTEDYRFDHLRFKKVKKSVIKRLFNPRHGELGSYDYAIDNHVDNLMELDLLYDLIKEGLVEKGD